jgi:hypothetical protein
LQEEPPSLQIEVMRWVGPPLGLFPLPPLSLSAVGGCGLRRRYWFT